MGIPLVFWGVLGWLANLGRSGGNPSGLLRGSAGTLRSFGGTLGGLHDLLGCLVGGLWGSCCTWGWEDVAFGGGPPVQGVQFALPCASVSPRVSQFQAHVQGLFLGCLTAPTPQLAHSIRLLLEYTETPYEEKLYSCGEGEEGLRGSPHHPQPLWLLGGHDITQLPLPSL